jgi:hypothetical protein
MAKSIFSSVLSSDFGELIVDVVCRSLRSILFAKYGTSE